ncbi:MAG: AzlD domain-containing protein [Clostridiales bacterium]|nr:AzlD domain-containing protein [Clostridiales bacterium]
MQIVLTILIIAGATAITRGLPFVLFPSDLHTPSYIRYLGGVLPCATIAMLIVYCMRHVEFVAWPNGIPELISTVAVILLQVRFKNMLISIAAGLALYMVLIRTVFETI